MGLVLEKENGGEHYYLSVYKYYKELILQGRLLPDSKMPSLRKCAEELHLSRTTIENAYLQLAADGYIISREKSGYYVTSIASQPHPNSLPQKKPKETLLYDISSFGVDKESFRFDLWQRYIKSALRQKERLLSYGDPQGEPDLREALADYVRERRNVLCTSEDIVIGAGVQSLLNILCPLLKDHKTVSFPTPSFIQGASVFSDYGFDVHYRHKDSDIIYVSPAHMTKWGDIMPISRRMELVRHASERGSLIIEDDFENEFVYLQKPTPSIYSLASGKDVVYVGSFSRLLLPSVRISFMVLPVSLREAYQKRASHYNQPASKAEQIALCQFIRDGHLAAQTRKLRRLYSVKMKELMDSINVVFGSAAQIQAGAGTSLALTVPSLKNAKRLQEEGTRAGLHMEILSESEDTCTFLLSCSSMPAESFIPALKLLRSIL